MTTPHSDTLPTAMAAYMAMRDDYATDAAKETLTFIRTALIYGMTLETVRYGLALLTRKHSQQAAQLADFSVAALADAEPVGILAHYPEETLEKAFTTLLPGDDNQKFFLPPDQLEDFQKGAARLSHAIVLDVGSQSITEATKEQPSLSGWKRYVHPDCCDRCQALASDKIFSEKDEFWTVHPNDRCIPIPVSKEKE